MEDAGLLSSLIIFGLVLLYIKYIGEPREQKLKDKRSKEFPSEFENRYYTNGKFDINKYNKTDSQLSDEEYGNINQ